MSDKENHKEKHIAKNVAAVGALTGFSRVLGLAREMLTSRLMGAGLEQSAFVFAFQIPNLFRKLFGEGALTAAFVPVFKERVVHGDSAGAERLARAVASMVFLLLGGVCAVGVAAISALIPFLEPDGKAAAVLRLTRIMLPYAAMICVAAFASGVLNGLDKFRRAALAPAILNMVWIATLAGLFFFPELPVWTRVEIVSWSVLLSGLLQMLFVMRAASKSGVTLKLTFSAWRESGVAKVWRNTAIGALGMGAQQVNLVLDNTLALWAAAYGASAIAYAERVVYLPLGVVATAFVTVLLPSLAGRFSRGELDDARALLGKSLEEMLALMIPAAAGLFLLAEDITWLLYESGASSKFTALDTVYVARAMRCYSLGLVAFSLHKMLAVWFHAQKDVRTPLQVAVMMIGLNLAFNIAGVVLLPDGWKHAGIAGSTVVCSFISSGVLVWIARRRGAAPDFGMVLANGAKLAAAAALMCLAAWQARALIGGLMETRGVHRIFIVFIPMAAAMLAYAVAALALCPAVMRRMLGGAALRRAAPRA